MPLTDSIREPLTEVESLIPGLAPTFAPQLPGIQTNKTLLYQTPGSSSNSEKPNLIETAKPPKSEFSRTETDAFITNKASDINSIPSANTSEPRTNSNPRDAANSEIDPLIGKLDSDSGDPLTNPNRITSPVITTSTTSEKASDKTPLPATAEISSKPEDKKTPLSSEATLKSESEPNQTSPATASTIISYPSTTSSEKSDRIAVTNLTETIAASPNIPPTDQTSTDKQSPVATVDDKIDSEKKAPIPSTSETKNSDKQLPVSEAVTLTDSDKKSPTVDAIPTEKPSSDSQLSPTTQPPTAPLIPATSNPVSPDGNISAEIKSTDLPNPVQTATQSSTNQQNDSGKVDPLKTEPAAIPKTAASENVAVTTATAAVETPEKTPNNTDSISEIKQPVKTEPIVSQSADAELIKTDKTATLSISQPAAKTESIIASIAEHSPAKTKIERDIVVTKTATELETEKPPAVAVNSLEPEPLISNSNQGEKTDAPIPALFSTPSETAAGTALITEVETSVLPSTLKSPPEPTSNNYNSNSNSTETVAVIPAYSDTKIAPKSAESASTLLASATEKSALISDNIADTQPNSTQRTGDLQTNTNTPKILSITAAANSPIPGTFIVDDRGEVKFDYQFDGGYFQGEIGIFSLAGMETFTPGTSEFIAEAFRRVLSNSTLGNIVIRDSTEGAKFTGSMPGEYDFGSGEYQGIKTFSMLPGDTFAVLLVPSGSVQLAYDNPWLGALFPEHRPLFSIGTANPNGTAHLLQIADITGSGNTFALEDMSAANSDRDYNDLIFKISGATGNAPLLDTVINPDKEWRNTPLGQQLLAEANPPNSDNNPPVVSPTSARTYTELETTISLENLAADVEGDPLTISVLNPVNGTVIFNPSTNKASFKPAPGFSGIASFDFLASDAFGSSTPARVSINVSDVPLLNLDFVKRNPRLNAGENTELVVLGDFADQKGVVLPDSYLTYTSINPEVAPIDAAGKVTGLVNGTSILSASRNNLQAVTPIRIGTLPEPTTETQQYQILAELYGLDSYPDAVSLTPGATRKLSLGLNSGLNEVNLTAASTGTRYFSNNSNILSVSPDGTITAVGIGDAAVTAIYGAAEVAIPVRVETPRTSTAAVGSDGGVVNSSDGTLTVMIPPGALEQNATVSIAPVNQQNLSLPLPPGFEFAGAFNLNFGDNSLNIPAQLAIPAPEGLAPGTQAYFLRKGAIPDATGTWNPIWLQEESGIVGDDGNIRTQSPPYPGVIRPGEYAVVYSSPTGSATLVKGQLTLNYNFPLAFFGIIDPQGNIGQLIKPDNFVTTPAFTVTRDISSVQLVAVPLVGLPVVTELGVQRNDDGTATFKAALNMPAPTSSDPTAPPVLQQAELKFKDENNQPFENGEPLLFLTGGNILVNNASDITGSRFEDLVAQFHVGNRVYEGTVLPNRSRNLGGNQFEIAVRVPGTVPLGASRIVMTRKQNQLVEQIGTAPVYEAIEYSSNFIELPQGAEYVFAALGSANRVAVLDGTDPESVVEATRSGDLLVSSIPVGGWAEATATTSDGTRAYVTLRQSGQVALVDPMVLRQVDTVPDILGVNPIALPAGALPGAIAIDPKDNYAYIADRNRGNVYVLDIDPFSPTYHQVVQTIAVGPAGPRTLRQMAISSDGRKLFVAAVGDGIYAINIDPKDRPSNPNSNDRKWHQQIGAIPTQRGAVGMTPTSNPSLIAFTSGNTGVDAQGYGVLEVTNDDPINFAATARRYAPLSLGSEQDYFDLNEAVSVTITRDGRYAFVAGRNSRSLQESADVRSGGNIGIISEPLGPNPRLVAATRPIPDALANDLVLSNDNKYLYASYPADEGKGVYVFDVEEMIRTLENPGQFRIDSLDRGIASPFFTTGRAVTNADFASVPIDDINPAISIAADYSITAENRPANQFTYGVPSGSVRGPLGTGGELRDLSAAPGDWLDLLSSGANINDLTPTLNWNFAPGWEAVEEVNLFVSTFDKDKGLLPWDEVVDLSDSTLLPGLSSTQKRELLSKPWGDYNDFNPNRILTATWKKDTGKWYGHDGITPLDQPLNDPANTSTNFTLPNSHTLTAGQTYYLGINARNGGAEITETKKFQTFLPFNNKEIFKSVTVFTNGFENQESLQPIQYERAFGVAKAGASNPDDPGTVMRYDGKTGEWQAVDEQGRIREDVTATSALGKPLVLLVDWATGGESVIPDSGFSEGAADAIFASLVKLDRDVNSKLFDSPMHLIGHSRGTIVTSEIVQRLGTYFGDKLGKKSTSGNDLHVTYLDAHDFKQKLPLGRYNTFYEPSVQVWDNVSFADNYFQEVPEPNHPLGVATPIGRNIPYAAPFPADLPINPETRLGEPDLSIRLGAYRDSNDSNTNPRNIGSNPSTAGNYSQNFAGFIKDSLIDPPGPHARVNWWYDGTTDLSLTDYPPDKPAPSIYRRLSDGSYERLFDRDFYNRYQTLNPWYQPDHTAAAFSFADPNAPWEGIGTGWFYSTLGGGKDLRPHTSNPRVPVDFDNTFAERMRGHAAVPSIFNGNFDAVTKPRDRFAPSPKQLLKWPYELPGWSFHNGSEERSYDSLYLEVVNPSETPDLYNYALSMGKPLVGDQIGAPTFLPALTEIDHNRLYVPQDTANLQLDLKVTKASADDVLQVYMTYFDHEGGKNVGSAFEGFKLDEVTVAGFKSLNLGDNPFNSFKAPGNTANLQFKLVDTNNDGLSAELLLDNIKFLKP